MKKYNKIENIYREILINSFNIDDNEPFVVTEKLHGSNLSFQIINDNIIPCSRKRVLDKDEYFYNYKEIYNEFKEDFELIKNTYQSNLAIYGEIIGKNIQKGIDYGFENPNEVEWYVFDVYDLDNEEWFDFHEVLNVCSVGTLPVVSWKVLTYREAMNIDIDNENPLDKTLGRDTIEGIVIRPYVREIYNHRNDRFILKNKRKCFLEKNSKKEKKVKNTNTVEHKLNEEFQRYFNNNRLQSVFSKEGENKNPSQIGKYIKLVIDDMKEDFDNDYEEQLKDLDKKQLKTVYNMGSIIAQELKKHL